MTTLEETAEIVEPPPGLTLAEARAHVRRVTEGSSTSFLAGMKSLPPERRDAMFAVYAFCREVDDIADEPAPVARRQAELAAWRREIDRLYAGRPTRPTTLALHRPIEAFALPKAEFIGMLDGMTMDAEERFAAPRPDAEVMLYCRRVAGTVGQLSIRVFGAEPDRAGPFALALADALQLTNILRDVDEDGARGRIYLPRELLFGAGLDPDAPIADLLSDPRLDGVCRTLAERARAAFDRADRLLAACERRTLVPALLMMGVYDLYLRLLCSEGWEPPRQRLRVAKWRKAYAALRFGRYRPAVAAS